MRIGRSRAACHHEAGHALARWYFGYFTDRAIVLTAEDVRARRWPENSLGDLVECVGMVSGHPIHVCIDAGVRYREDPEGRRPAEIARDQDLIGCFSGMAAEAAYRHWSLTPCLIGGGERDFADIAFIMDNWGLSDTEEREVLRAAERRAVALVRSRRGASAVRAMADALMERGEIDGKEIDYLCRAAYGGRQPEFGAWNDHWPPTLSEIRASHIPSSVAERSAA